MKFSREHQNKQKDVVEESKVDLADPTYVRKKSRAASKEENKKIFDFLIPDNRITSEAWTTNSPSIRVFEIEEPDLPFDQKIRNWCFETKEFFKCENIFTVTFIVSIFLGAILVSIFLSVYTIIQKNSNSKYNTVPLYESNGGNLYIGQDCSQYYMTGNGSFCVFGAYCDATNGYVCQCSSQTYYDTFLGYCAPKKTIGTFCVDSFECDNTLHLVCGFEGFCVCYSGFTWSSLLGTSQCIRIREVGETCISTGDCTAGSYCMNSTSGLNRCLCPYGQYPSHSSRRCEVILQVFERCYEYSYSTLQRCQPYSTCKIASTGDGMTYCLCIQGYYFDTTSASCLQQKSVGQSCKTNVECLTSNNYICLDSACQCSTSTYWNGTYCAAKLGYGQSCNITSNCNNTLICSLLVQSLVTQYACICDSGYFYDDYSQQCLTYVPIGGACFSSIQCDESAYCASNNFLSSTSSSSDSQCACFPGYGVNISTGACVPLSTINQTCTTTNDCISFYFLTCISSLCQCNKYSFWNGASCQLSHTFNENCTTSIPCRSYEALTCSSNSTCQCLSGSTFNTTYDYCS